MATIEKRLTVTPSPTVGPLLREMAKITGKSETRVIREILDEAAPAMAEVIEAMRQAKKRPQEAQAAVMRMAAQAHQSISQATLDLDKAIRRKPGRKPGRKLGRGAAKT